MLLSDFGLQQDVQRWLGWLGWTVASPDGAAMYRQHHSLMGLGLAVPDLMLAYGGRSLAAEVKYKTHSSRGDTGIDVESFDSYFGIALRTRQDVFLVFGHREEDQLLSGPLDNPAMRVNRGAAFGRGGMVFYPVESLMLHGRLSDLQRQRYDALQPGIFALEVPA